MRLLGPTAASLARLGGDRRYTGRYLTIYTDEACTTPAAIAVWNPAAAGAVGASISLSRFILDEHSRPPLFWFPPGFRRVYGLVSRNGPVVALDALTGVLDVTAFGAAGDGATDDTTAVQAAIDLAAAAGGGAVLLPAAAVSYRVSTLTLRSGVTVAGEGGLLPGQPGSVLHQLAGAAGQHLLTGSGITNVVVRDLAIRGTAPGGGVGDGVHLTAAEGPVQNVALENVVVDHMPGRGVFLGDAIASWLSGVRVQNCGGHGFHTDLGTSLTLRSCYANGCLGVGYLMQHTAYAQFDGCASDSCAAGYVLDHCLNVATSACGCEQPEARGDWPGCGFVTTGGSMVTHTSPYVSGAPGIGHWVTGGCEGATLIQPAAVNAPPGAGAAVKVDSGSQGFVIGRNAQVVSGGGLLYQDGGALKYKGPNGTVTTIAPA